MFDVCVWLGGVCVKEKRVRRGSVEGSRGKQTLDAGDVKHFNQIWRE